MAAINTVGDLIGALQHHSNTQKVLVNKQPINAVIAQTGTTGTVVIYTLQVPTPTSVAVVGNALSSPQRLEEDGPA